MQYKIFKFLIYITVFFACKDGNVPKHISSSDPLTYRGDIIIESDEDTLLIPSWFANHKILDGDLIISNTSLKHLKMFRNLKEVRGTLRLYNNCCLEDLKDLENIEFVKSFKFQNNKALKNLTHIGGWEITDDFSLWQFYGDSIPVLPNCTQLDGNLEVGYCPTIKNIIFLPNLTKVEGVVRIFDNKGLMSIGGLNKVENIGKGLSIFFNSKMKTISGLNGLKKIGGTVFLANGIMTHFDAFKSIDSINGDLHVRYNNSLQSLYGIHRVSKLNKLHIKFNGNLLSLEGLEGLREIDALEIEHNDNLLTLAGLEDLEKISSYAEFRFNEKLSNFCGLKNALTKNPFPNIVIEVVGNADNPSVSEILLNCP